MCFFPGVASLLSLPCAAELSSSLSGRAAKSPKFIKLLRFSSDWTTTGGYQRIIMAKNKVKTIDSFFKKKPRLDAAVENNSVEEEDHGEEEEVHEEEEEEEEEEQDVVEEENPPRIQRVDDGSGVLIVERDPGLRCQIWDHPVNAQEQARKAHVKHGPYQIKKNVYPLSHGKYPRRLSSSMKFSLVVRSLLERASINRKMFCFNGLYISCVRCVKGTLGGCNTPDEIPAGLWLVQAAFFSMERSSRSADFSFTHPRSPSENQDWESRSAMAVSSTFFLCWKLLFGDTTSRAHRILRYVALELSTAHS